MGCLVCTFSKLPKTKTKKWSVPVEEMFWLNSDVSGLRSLWWGLRLCAGLVISGSCSTASCKSQPHSFHICSFCCCIGGWSWWHTFGLDQTCLCWVFFCVCEGIKKNCFMFWWIPALTSKSHMSLRRKETSMCLCSNISFNVFFLSVFDSH